MSIAGWELDSFALLRLMDYMQMIHSLLLLFDPSTPAVWKSTRDIFGWRWFFIIIIIIVPTHARIICTQTYIHTRMQANSLVMVLCSRTCWKQSCQKTGCFFSFGWICLPNCMALKKNCFSANTSVKVVRVSFYSLTSPRVEGENERIFSSSFLNANFLILKALRARGHLEYLARHHAKGHCFSCNTSFSPAETIQPCALRPTTLLDSYFPSFHLLGVTDFHRFPSFFRLISLLFWLPFRCFDSQSSSRNFHLPSSLWKSWSGLVFVMLSTFCPSSYPRSGSNPSSRSFCFSFTFFVCFCLSGPVRGI